jgi:plastocyanin
MPKNRTPHPRSSAILRATTLSLLATAVACGGGGDNSPTNPGGNNNTNNTVASVSVGGNTTTVNVGESVTLTATARNSAGTPVSATFAWATGQPSIATVNASTGVVTGVAVGTASITASAGGFTGTRIMTVSTPTNPGPPPNSVTVDMPGTTFEPNVFRLAIGGTVTFVFTAVAHDVNFSGGNGTPSQIPVTQNATVQRTFPAAGTFNIVCTLHAGMTGVITVQ